MVAGWWFIGDDFTFASWEDGIPKLLDDMKVRGILGGGSSDDEEVTILGRRLRWRRYQNHRVRG